MLQRALLLGLLVAGLWATSAAEAYESLAVGGAHACVLRADDSLLCWGSKYNRLPSPPAGAFGAVAAGTFNSCGLRLADRSIVCWGLYAPYWQPQLPTGPIASVGIGTFHLCVVVAGDGHVRCVGQNDYGQADAPTGAFKAVTAGWSHTCAIRLDDTVACWGEDSWVGKTHPPSGTFAQISAGQEHNCGLRFSGAVVCWGFDREGQTQAPPGTFTAVSAGTNHSCAVRTDDAIACWGDDTYGQSHAPPGRFRAVGAGHLFTCGLHLDGSVACWGANDGGQANPPDEPPKTPPRTTIALDPPSPDGSNGWYVSRVRVRVSAVSGEPDVPVVETYCQLDRVPPPTVMWDIPPACAYLGAGADVTAGGQHFLWAASRDIQFNVELPVGRSFRIDRTPPSVHCSVDRSALWPPNHRLVPVAVNVSVDDAGSGPAGYRLHSVTSDQPDARTGPHAADVQGWAIGAADGQGLLRAERDGGRTRHYALTYRGFDTAGNATDCRVAVAVPTHAS